MSENWVPVKDFEGLYEVSDLGNVRSLSRVRADGKPMTGRVLKPGTVNYLGHLKVMLAYDGVYTSKLVHHLVLEAFVAPRPPGAETRHLDGVPWNNVPSNLCWGTSGENNDDQVRHGTHPESSRTLCLWLHELKTPNLVAYELPKRRRCLACEKARGYARARGQSKSRELADAYYAEIMGA